MARIAGVDLPRDKRVEVALTYIFGIGPSRAKNIIAATGVNPDTRVRDLTESEISKLRENIDKNYRVKAICSGMCRWKSSACWKSAVTGV